MQDRLNPLELHKNGTKKGTTTQSRLRAAMGLILRVALRWKIFVYYPVVRLPLPSLPFHLSVGRHQVLGQMPLKLVVISDALHAPNDQLLIKNIIH